MISTMSTPSVHTETLPEHDGTAERGSSTVFRSIAQRVFDPLRMLGFWSAIALPFLYVPLLATGLETVAQTTVFLALLALNVVALLIGRSYRPD